MYIYTNTHTLKTLTLFFFLSLSLCLYTCMKQTWKKASPARRGSSWAALNMPPTASCTLPTRCNSTPVYVHTHTCTNTSVRVCCMYVCVC